eukprot:TRINITY_DN42033_c0_g1_i1.p1 TRINITY_DN42033_c0_g1~~TRINITY_DN42033_c0_g1_i1.p1  ORF type:complete len:219 (-),score=33.29 TRINITY_DN42033_c0_g1_i1:528-1127(-)
MPRPKRSLFKPTLFTVEEDDEDFFRATPSSETRPPRCTARCTAADKSSQFWIPGSSCALKLPPRYGSIAAVLVGTHAYGFTSLLQVVLAVQQGYEEDTVPGSSFERHAPRFLDRGAGDLQEAHMEDQMYARSQRRALDDHSGSRGQCRDSHERLNTTHGQDAIKKVSPRCCHECGKLRRSEVRFCDWCGIYLALPGAVA